MQEFFNYFIFDTIKTMKQNDNLTIFNGKKIRRVWDKENEKWYFSVVDIIAVLTNQDDFTKARKY